MTKALLLLTLSASALAACGPAANRAAPGRAAYVPPPLPSAQARAGLDKVIGQDARALTALFGQPDADVTEGVGRKMQFGSRICVLDAYLYPPAKGGVATVAHVDTRQRDGASIDRASCVAALTRRDGGK